jgi:hypothetical protein
VGQGGWFGAFRGYSKIKEAFFFEKRTKKLLLIQARAFPEGNALTDKSFLLPFLKKEDLPSLPT